MNTTKIGSAADYSHGYISAIYTNLLKLNCGASIKPVQNTHCFRIWFETSSEVKTVAINQDEFSEEPLIIMPITWTVGILTVVLHSVCA